MALSQDKWFEILKRMVPKWYFEEENLNVAVFQGFAAVLARLDLAADNHLKETYICQAEGGYLDEHGFERNLERALGELDAEFCERIRNLTNSTSCPSIKTIVDALLKIGEATILEDHKDLVFFDREHFFNRGELLVEEIYNAFSIIVDKQVHAPYSFFSRENFFGREDFWGQQDSLTALFELIVQAVNRAKALGTVYRLVELQE